MKKKVLVAFVLLLIIFNVVTVYAGTAIYGYFFGYEKVRLVLDGEEVVTRVPGFIIDGATVVPLRIFAESLDVIVRWDDEAKTAYMYRPNVNMQFTANPVYDESKKTYVVYSPFGKVPKSQRYNFTFYVYSEIDSLPNEVVQVKIVLKDPNGEIVSEGDVQSYDASIENSLQYIQPFKNVTFTQSGNYYVEFLLKSDSTNSAFSKIGEKLILVK